MAFVLNLKKGTCVNHPLIGKLKGGTAVEIQDRHANMFKNIINLHVFNDVILKEKVVEEVEIEIEVKEDKEKEDKNGSNISRN